MALDGTSQSNTEALIPAVETQETSREKPTEVAEQSFEEVRQLKESRDHALSTAQREAEELLGADQSSDLASMQQAIVDAKNLIASQESKRDTRIDAYNNVIDPIRSQVKKILRVTETIANSLESARKSNSMITNEAQRINIDLPNINKLTQLEVKAQEIDSELDLFEADAYKLVASEVIDDLNKPYEDLPTSLKLASETPQEKSARDTENEVAKEAGW
ncbi:MAG: hypothetical protein ABIA83_03180 [Patescibacteria group bacterium]